MHPYECPIFKSTGTRSSNNVTWQPSPPFARVRIESFKCCMQCGVAHFQGRSRVKNYSTQQPLEQRRPSMPTVTRRAAHAGSPGLPPPRGRVRSHSPASSDRTAAASDPSPSGAKVFHDNECLMRDVSDCSSSALHLFTCGHLFCASCVLGGLRAQTSSKRLTEARAAERKLQECEGTEAYRGVVACCHDKTQVHVLLVQQ
jgi:hypothetical protein